jgi:hypothetical protein
MADPGDRLPPKAPLSDSPLVVGLDEHGGDETQDGRVVGKDPHRVGASLDLSVVRSTRFVDHNLRQ